jgi:HK97 family phage prohead protease
VNLTTASLLLTKRATLTAGQFAGIAASFSPAPDRQGDRILAGAFTASIAAWAARERTPPVLWDHCSEVVIGAILSMAETDRGLEVTGQLLQGNDQADQARELMQLGALSLSIGALAEPGSIVLAADGSRVLQVLDLMEISITPTPADAGALILASKSLAAGSQRDLQDALRERLGFSKRQAERLLKSGWAGLHQAGDYTHEPDQPEAELASIAARISGLTQSLRS